MIIDQIVSTKKERLKEKKCVLPENTLMELAHANIKYEKKKSNAAPPNLLSALKASSKSAIIAEVKRASPSKGILNSHFTPLSLALTYQQQGASAVSVLTEEDFFLGSDWYLYKISRELSIPTLRKDFIIDPYQVYESKLLGASGVLLITGLLSDELLYELFNLITELDMTPLIEISNQEELNRVLSLPIKLQLTGINNRNFQTFETDISTTKFLAEKIPSDTVIVSESGIHTTNDLQKITDFGAHGALIGESLVTSKDPGAQLKKLNSVPVL